MKRQGLQATMAAIELCLVVVFASACQLITGVNDLRVESRRDPRSDTDETKDAEAPRNDGGAATSNGDKSNGSDSKDSGGAPTNDTSSGPSDDTDPVSNDSDDQGDASQTSSDSETTTRPEAGPDATDTTDPSECEIPAPLACAPITNCGCDQGMVCTVISDDDTLTVGCVQPGEAQLGDACEPGSCGSGYHCWDGVCRQGCNRGADCEQEGASCERLDGEDEILGKVRYCEAACDLASPTDPGEGFYACPDGQACIRTTTSSVCTTASGTNVQGALCEHDTDCVAGHGCLDGVCMAWCDPEDGSCGSWAVCTLRDDVATIPGGIGACEGTCEIATELGSTCSVIPNCGCPGGQGCRVVEVTGRAECSVIGFGEAQSACEYDYDCQSGFGCVGALCRPYCDPDAPECPQSAGCFQLYFGDEEVDGVGICGGSCDPVWPDTEDESFTPCGDGALCQPGFPGADLVVPHCIAIGDETLVDYGETCDPSADLCDYGSVCTGTCDLLCREALDCDGYTATPECIGAPEPLLDTDSSELGVCCLPPAVTGSECSAYGVNCGCADGETCRLGVDGQGSLYNDGRTACSGVGEVSVQNVCVVDTDCAAATSCVDGLCRPHCADECSATSGTCAQISVREVDVPGARVCLGLCDPRAPEEATAQWDGCGDDVKCIAGVPGDPDFPLSQCAASTGDSGEGQSCDRHTDCRAGLACICTDDDCATAACMPWCVSDEDCDAGTECMALGLQITPGVTLGFCGE